MNITTTYDEAMVKAMIAEAVAKERNSWPAEMEAMERQVNILTDALNDRQRWFDALEAQHKQAILAVREACSKVCEIANPHKDYGVLVGAKLSGYIFGCDDCAAAIRARGEQ